MIRELLGLAFVLLGLAVIAIVFAHVGWWGLCYLLGSILVVAGLALVSRRATPESEKDLDSGG